MSLLSVLGTPARLAGAALMLGCVLLYEPGGASDVQRLWLPLAMGAAAALILQNLLGALLAGIFLAAIHTDSSGDWISRLAYPTVVALCLLGVMYIGVRRFRARIQATHEERWRARRGEPGEHDE